MLAALVLASMPPRPALRSLPLPAKLAGGLFLFKTSVPAADKPFAGKLLAEAQQALRDDPRVTMELGAVSDRHSRTRASQMADPVLCLVLCARASRQAASFRAPRAHAWATTASLRA